MDGNRRFAKKRNQPSQAGHSEGFHSLHRTLEWCLDIGIKVVTVYAFSIENFKRSEEEVNALMNLFEEKLEEFGNHRSLIQRHGVCVRVVGDVSLLRESTRRAVDKIMRDTQNESNAILYIACPYTSHEEMHRARMIVEEGLAHGALETTDVDPDVLDQCMYVSEPVDILVRTSGEVRLSDFLLWQTTQDTFIHFVDVLWPAFDFWHMVPILLSFQAYCHVQQVSLI
jgi:ditrans,polycis-polyprenyl diphosphate synthase